MNEGGAHGAARSSWGLVLVAVSAAAALMSRRKPVHAVVRQERIDLTAKSRGEGVLHRDREEIQEDYLFRSRGFQMETLRDAGIIHPSQEISTIAALLRWGFVDATVHRSPDEPLARFDITAWHCMIWWGGADPVIPKNRYGPLRRILHGHKRAQSSVSVTALRASRSKPATDLGQARGSRNSVRAVSIEPCRNFLSVPTREIADCHHRRNGDSSGTRWSTC